MNNYKPNYKLTTKDIAELNYCSLRTADRIKRQIKDFCKVKIVRFKHYQKYFDEL